MKKKRRTHHRLRMAAITFCSDLIALTFSTIAIHVLIYRKIRFNFLGIDEIEHILFMFMCLSLFTVTKLYPGIGLNPAFELKSVTQHTTLSFIIVFTLLAIFEPLKNHSSATLTLIYGASIVMILALRWGGRILMVQLDLWGEPVVVIGRKEKIGTLVRFFNDRRRLGFVPVLGVTEMTENTATTPIVLMEVDDFFNLPENYFAQKDIYTILVDTLIVSDLAKMHANRILLRRFERMIFVSDLDWLEGVSISYHDFEGMLGMEAQRNLLSPLDVVVKRTMDILISITFGILAWPMLLLIALLIRLDSPGPILYTQMRVGQDRRNPNNRGRRVGHLRRIKIYKFRTMVVNAEHVLEETLNADPLLRKEWEFTQKLQKDPRITRIGRWIRRFSIDELPQLINVFKGEMSLIGPRPILPEQCNFYGDGFEVYSSVRPGLTGFWQVSGRNHTTFQARALYDEYYVRNWSIWLDIYILLRTVWVVASRDGAY